MTWPFLYTQVSDTYRVRLALHCLLLSMLAISLVAIIIQARVGTDIKPYNKKCKNGDCHC